MNDKDKEAFLNWCHSDAGDTMLSTGEPEWVWYAACEYKDKEYSNLMDAMTRTSQYNAKLQDENNKLKEENKQLKIKYEDLDIDSASVIEKIKEENKRMREGIQIIGKYYNETYPTGFEFTSTDYEYSIYTIINKLLKIY